MLDRILNTKSNQVSAFIDGQWVEAADGATLDVTNPADGTLVAKVAKCGAPETRRAIEAAEKALPGWRDKTAKERAAIIARFGALIKENLEGLAQLLTLEQGKPLAEARAEVASGASYFDWFAAETLRVYGDVIPGPTPDKRVLVIKQPVGVVACITPWNFPSAMLARKVAPALAAGCTVVCKPASETPLSSLILADLAIEAGVPNGVINIVCGKTAEIGNELTTHPTIRKITFTGSTQVGKMLTEKSAGTLKRLSMELGGNAPFIVFDDADIDSAVQGAIISKFRNAGQTCVCSNRILVQDKVYDEFCKKFTEAAGKLTLGRGSDDNVTMGPLISASAAKTVFSLIEDARSRGATVLMGGDFSSHGNNYIDPTILADISTDARVFREEIFGPVAPVFKFKTEDEAIALANDTEYGLAAYFYARDIGRIWRVGEALDFGMIGINEGIVSNEAAPFGGVKESGQGREGSKYGLDDYLEIKYLCVGGI